ncbi:tonB-system energizer ExbB [Pararhodospirillum photometricum]|uniref:Biopolymer transport protein ExbB n=1 Tax=Pararhodospirillum photometricum DSM 122 TaxID=1150469 RepID=H6SQJ4_PARPM|nr:tonB-system energizer ExbB [Pararhodospirillum photometricum]CCG09713.1 Biopolymer transport ExbB protein [Pararhodospirillum photometricum DSM 122]
MTDPSPTAVPSPPALPEPPPGIDASLLPHDLSPWTMFHNADPLVQGIMIGLAVASVLTWTIGLGKGVELVLARRRTRKLSRVLAAGAPLTDTLERLRHDRGPETVLVNAVALELRLLPPPSSSGSGVQERIASRLARLEAAAGRRIALGTGLLATVGATAPFVGLFGTVWGIMNSFIGISRAQTTNLAVVAPGIAEALLATALGLAAAIPAVVLYNMVARGIGGYRAMLADLAADLQRLVSRDLERAGRPLKEGA